MLGHLMEIDLRRIEIISPGPQIIALEQAISDDIHEHIHKSIRQRTMESANIGRTQDMPLTWGRTGISSRDS
jgi:hypothetical protein